MAAKPSIAAAAEAYMVFYINVILSPTYITTAFRAEGMASHYHLSINFFADEQVMQISDHKVLTTLIAETLDKLETNQGMLLEEKEHRVKVLGEASAVMLLVWKRKEIAWTNLYFFFRRMESGEVGFDGGVVDGELGMLKQLTKEQRGECKLSM